MVVDDIDETYESGHVKYPKVRALGTAEVAGIFDNIDDTIYISEKFDGANVQFRLMGGELIMGSRNQKVSVNGVGHCQFIGLTHVWDKFGFDPSQLNPDYIYYGESMNRHTIDYGDNVPPFIGFDILDKTTGRFLPPPEIQTEYELLDLYCTNTLWSGPPDEKIISDIDGWNELELKSTFGDTTVEGLVIKNYDRLSHYGRPLFAKVVNEKFREVKNIPKPKVDYSAEYDIMKKYCTAARLNKVVATIIECGDTVDDMTVMPVLFNLMVDDILAEHILDIRRDVKSINFASLNKLVGQRTARLLQNYFKDMAAMPGSDK